MRETRRLGFFAVLLSLVGCAEHRSLSNEAFQRAIRESRLQCDTIVSAEALNSSKTAWRVVCADTATYMAMVQHDGNLCVEPMPIGDFLVGDPNNRKSACVQ